MTDMNPTNTEATPYNPAVRSYATDLLGYLGKPGGTVPGGFTAGMFELWAKADIFNRAVIAQGWPSIAFVLNANDTGGEAELHRIAGN